LASSIPNLSLDNHLIDDEGFDGELYSDGSFGVVSKNVFGELGKEIGLAYP